MPSLDAGAGLVVKPVLFELGGLEVQAYGVSKALAAVVAAWLLSHALRRVGRDPDLAVPLVLAATVGGFVGAKLYYLFEVSGSLTLHDFGGSGFTWYGGVLGGAAAVALVARARDVPLGLLSGLAVVPLAVAYGIGRLGCLLAGDGTYGTPTDLPWAMSFPEGMVPTDELVHPTPLYEAIGAFLIAGLLWRVADRFAPVARFRLFIMLMGTARFLVEFVRLNDDVVAGLTAAQAWSAALIALGAGLMLRDRRAGAPAGEVAAATAR